jgi:hypothetical protein
VCHAALLKQIGAFLEFSRLRRPQIIEDNPGIAFGATGKVLGEEWRTMNPETKKKFQDIEAADRLRYEREMEKYNSPAVKAVRIHHRSAMPFGVELASTEDVSAFIS